MTIEEYRRDQAWLEAVREDRRRNEAAMQARYDAINKAWEASDIPAYVLRTPDWQEGWRIVLDWIRPGVIRKCGLDVWEKMSDLVPMTYAGWAREVHILSHSWGPAPISGHCPEHAAAEEEFARAILEWWAVTKAAAPG